MKLADTPSSARSDELLTTCHSKILAPGKIKDAPMPQQQFSSYEEFFTFYLHEHSDARNRAMHAAGTLLGLCTLIVPFAIGHPWYALLWPLVAYGFAWTGHFLMEGNKPATFGHPLWSFISDFRMLGLMVTGRLKARMSVTPAKDARSA
jgi:hypothetical protein